MKSHYLKPELIKLSVNGKLFTSSIAQQYVTFNLDQSSCRSGGPVLQIVNNVALDCISPDNYATFISWEITFTCQGDPKEYLLLTTDVVESGLETPLSCGGPGEVSSIHTFSFPQGAPEGTCVVETYIIPDLGGNVCE